jgi:integrase/recombinase XerD
MNLENLHHILNSYLTTREAIGLKDRHHRKLLEDFLQYVSKEQPAGPIPAQLVVDWACSTPHPDAIASQSFRFRIARAFLIHVKTVLPETEIPPGRYLRAQRRPTPCLLSLDNILRLLDCVGDLKSRGSLRPHTYRTIIGLLACTGLRASEAVRLRVSDVQLDLDPPVLHIFETKFRKSRLVPLHSTTAEVLRHYKKLRSEGRVVWPADPFFISAKGASVPYYTLKNLFARLVRRAGVAGADHQRSPSLHSLRHSFAVQRLTIWYQEGRDVRSLAPHLSVYMGHAHLSASYWYLSASPDLLNAAADRFYVYTRKEGEHD